MTRSARLLILAAVGGGCLIVLMTVWGPRRNHATIMANRPTSEELEREIRAELPIGSSLSTVQGCLTRRELEFSFQTSSRTIVAIARRLPGSTAVVSKSLQLEFLFDDASKLKSIDAKVLYTGA
jgi:hypothetical protein